MESPRKKDTTARNDRAPMYGSLFMALYFDLLREYRLVRNTR